MLSRSDEPGGAAVAGVPVRRLVLTVAVLSLIGVVALVALVVSPGRDAGGPGVEQVAAPDAEDVTGAVPAGADRAGDEPSRRCTDALGPLAAELGLVHVRIENGVRRPELMRLVRRVGRTTAAMDTAELPGPRCRQVAARLTRAHDLYDRSARAWGRCEVDRRCDVHRLQPVLVVQWSLADRAASRGSALLRDLDGDTGVPAA